MANQEYTSANTSLKQIPALHKKMWRLMKGTNFDNGAGKYDLATEFLKDKGIENICYDPYNRSEQENKTALTYEGKCATSTVANVLNVIAEEEAQIEVLKLSHKMLMDDGIIFISIYQGKNNGKGCETKDGCWQNNKSVKSYLPTVWKVFPKAIYKQGIIIARK